MADELDVEAMINRFRERAEAVRSRPLPPVGGEERTPVHPPGPRGFPGLRHHRRRHRGPSKTALLVLRVDLRPPADS